MSARDSLYASIVVSLPAKITVMNRHTLYSQCLPLINEAESKFFRRKDKPAQAIP